MHHLGTIMSNRSVISVHTTPELAERLERLAKITHRSKSSLAQQAIAGYVEAEETFIESVQQGIADVEAGRAYTTDEMRAYFKEKYLTQSNNK